RRAEALSDGKPRAAWHDIRPTRAEIDLDALRANAAWVKRHIGAAQLLAVIKADAYGHGAVTIARALGETAASGLCVSLTEEGFELRGAGIGAPILVMGGIYGGAHDDVLAHDLTPVVFDLQDVEAFARSGRTVGVHVKVDTGMSRLGVRPEHLDEFLEGCARFPGIRIEGLMTHLATADSDAELVHLQLDRFAAALPRVRAEARGPLLLHAANTAGTLGFPEAHLDAVRPGLALSAGGHPGLGPALRFVTRIVALRDLQPGDPVSSGPYFRAPRPTRVATLPVGYADAYPRRLAAPIAARPADVLVRGRRCPIVG